jgi:uncharacterized membrane protein
MEKHSMTLKRLRLGIGVTAEPPTPISPARIKQAEERAASTQNTIADAITRFAGSMGFVYIHVIWFASWIAFHVERYPYGLLTMIVSLEAIFLSTFVMISQNRADSKREVIANEQWSTVQEEDQQNRQLLDISNQILDLTKAVHAYASAAAGPGTAGAALPNPSPVAAPEASSDGAPTAGS